MKKFQQIQNIAARYVTGARKYDHITPILVQLHCLPVSYRIVFKHLFFVYKSLNGLCPQYLTNLLEHRKSARVFARMFKTCQSSQLVKPKHLVIEPFLFVLRRFELNTIPLEIRQSSSVLLFKKKLKTFLFVRFMESKSLYF